MANVMEVCILQGNGKMKMQYLRKSVSIHNILTFFVVNMTMESVTISVLILFIRIVILMISATCLTNHFHLHCKMESVSPTYITLKHVASNLEIVRNATVSFRIWD